MIAALIRDESNEAELARVEKQYADVGKRFDKCAADLLHQALVNAGYEGDVGAELNKLDLTHLKALAGELEGLDHAIETLGRQIDRENGGPVEL